jgi:hypothetical protein
MIPSVGNPKDLFVFTNFLKSFRDPTKEFGEPSKKQSRPTDQIHVFLSFFRRRSLRDMPPGPRRTFESRFFLSWKCPNVFHFIDRRS